jgi:iron(III) transport system permease protein
VSPVAATSLPTALRDRDERWPISGRTLCYLSVFTLTITLVLAPLVMLFLTALNLGPIAEPDRGLSLQNYLAAWSSPTTYTTLANTVLFALGATAVAVVVGASLAFLVERTDMPLKTVAYVAITSTLAMPGMLYAIAWVLLASPRIGLFNLALLRLFARDDGLLTAWAGIGLTEAPIQPYGLGGMIVVEGLRSAGLVFLITVGVFRNMDPALEEAAAVSGAPIRTVVRRITLRLMVPGILAAAVYVFAQSLDAFEVPAVLGMQSAVFVLSTKIYLLVKNEDHGLASALGVGFVAIAVGLVLWYGRLTRRIERFTTVTGKGFRPRTLPLGRLRRLAWLAVAAYFSVVVLAPFLVLVWASLVPFYQVPSLAMLERVTLKAYWYVFVDPWGFSALKNTLILVVTVPAATMVLAALISWFVVKTRLRGRRLLDVLAFLPQVSPSIITALAFIYMFLTMPFKLIPAYGTIWIIVAALVSNLLPYGTRTMHGAVMQIHKELEEAALTGGVAWGRTFIHVVTPLLLPAMISGWVFIAMAAVRYVTLPLLLYSPGSRVVSLLMWDNWQGGEIAKAAATGVVLMIAIGLITLAGRLADRRRARQWTSG